MASSVGSRWGRPSTRGILLVAAAMLGLVGARAAMAESLTLPAEAGYGSVAYLGCPSGTITVISATYGSNISWVPVGNATAQVAAACGGQTSCAYAVYYSVLGDPAYGYPKTFTVDWSCGGGACQIGPTGSGNINAYYAGLYDYYCGAYGGYYCQYALSYAASAGVHVLATGTGSCSTAGLNDYYCRMYEYYGYGWDYAGYCSAANAAAVSGACTGSCSGGACVPTTCAAQGKNCGTIGDGCGGTLSCGMCSGSQTCGGGGTANVCGCTPTVSCASAGKNCGTIGDGCGNTLNCGTCPANQTCSEQNVCVASSSIPGGSYNSMYSCNSAGQPALLGQGGVDRCIGLVGLNCDGIGSSPSNPGATPGQPPAWTCDAVRHDLSRKNDSLGNPICLDYSEPGAASHQCCGFFTDAEGSYFLGAGNTTADRPTVIPGNNKGDYIGPNGEHYCNLDTTHPLITVWNGGAWVSIANPLFADGYNRSCPTPAEFCGGIGAATTSPNIRSWQQPYGWQVKLGNDYAANASNQGQIVGPASVESRVQDFPAYLSTDVKAETIDPDLDGRIFAVSNPNGGRVKLGVSGAGSGLIVIRLGPDSLVCQRHYPNCSVTGVQQALASGVSPAQVFATGSGICGGDWCSIAGLYNLAKSNPQALFNELEAISRAGAGQAGQFYQSRPCDPISKMFIIPGSTVCGQSTPSSGIAHGTGGNCRALPFYQIALKHGFAWYDAYLDPGLYGLFLTSRSTNFHADAVKNGIYAAANLLCGQVWSGLFNAVTALFQSFYTFDGHMLRRPHDRGLLRLPGLRGIPAGASVRRRRAVGDAQHHPREHLYARRRRALLRRVGHVDGARVHHPGGRVGHVEQQPLRPQALRLRPRRLAIGGLDRDRHRHVRAANRLRLRHRPAPRERADPRRTRLQQLVLRNRVRADQRLRTGLLRRLRLHAAGRQRHGVRRLLHRHVESGVAHLRG